MKKLIAAALLPFAMLAHAEFAQDLAIKFPGLVDAKIAPAFPGFYSVIRGSEVVYVKEDLSIMINGDVVDLSTGRSMTADLRAANKPIIDISKFNPSDAIAFGNGPRKVYVFSDPDCPYCRQLENELDKVKDVTVLMFPYPIASLHPEATRIAKNIWCSKDKATAWKQYLLGNKKPAAGECDNPIDRNLAVGQKFQINGTPTLVFEDGTLVGGAIPAERIEAQLATATAKKKI